MFKITITETRTETQPRKEYRQVADTGNPRDGGKVYEYVAADLPTTVQRDVLTQEVETLDLAAVIKAVNNL